MNTIKEVSEFFNDWEIYSQVLKHNYMYHKEIYQVVGALLQKHLENQPFTLLDLGCGDASFISEALQGLAISHYTGFDISDSALTFAADNIAKLGCDSTLINTDLMLGLSEIKERFDIIFTSFALHHLTYAEKVQFFNLARASLSEGGILCVIDTMREPTESLFVYLDNYCQWIRETWNVFNESELAAIYQHIRNNDMPETVEILNNLATSAGFNKNEHIYQVFWHHVLTFRV